MNQSKTSHSLFIKSAFTLALAFALSAPMQALQLNTFQSAEDSVYSIAEKMPEFQGGEKAVVDFLNQTIEYPAEAQKKNEQGKVIVQFVIGKTGKVEQAKVLKGVSPALDKEALRVIGLLPDWAPGEQNGQKVAVYRVLPIAFQNVPPEDLWEANEKTVIVIDSVKMPATFNINILNSDKLATAEVLKPFPQEQKSRLMKKYGKQAADGVVLINTKKDEIYYALADSIKEKAGCKEAAIMPQFPGGKAQLQNYLADSVQYPFVAKQLKKEGKVFVQFRVDKTGKLSDAKIIRSADYFLDKEALRVVNSMPQWVPGAKCDEKLNILVTMPVAFKLDIPAVEKGWERNAKTIILLDGVRLPSSFNLEWLNYANLTTYKVLQPTSKEITKKLVSQYGKDAANGVILIGTK